MHQKFESKGEYMTQGKRIRKYTQNHFNRVIKDLRGEQEGEVEYRFLFLIRRALLQDNPKIVLHEEGKKILKKELFSIVAFSSRWRILERQLVAIEILGMIGKGDAEFVHFCSAV